MSQEQLEALLGRPLTSIEAANRKLYLEIARESLEELLCISLDCQSIEEPRTFDVRDGYSTVFTDIFTEITEVKVDGEATTDYYKAFWDKRTNDYYNSIVLGDRDISEVEITASWGFDGMPRDLKMLQAQVFADTSKKYVVGSGNVKSKRVEDFQVTYGDLTDDKVFLSANARVIRKYSMCNVGYIRHGSTCSNHGRYDCGYCI